MDIDQIKILLERYNQGNCTPEEAALVEQWFDRIDNQQPAGNKETLQFQLNEVKSRLDAQLTPSVPQHRTSRRYTFAAAAAVLLIVAGAIFWQHQNQPAGEQASNSTKTTSPALATHSVKDGFIEISTPKTVKDSIRLPDGSTILLNAGSRLRYPQQFGNTERNIWLEEGEAFFDAAQDASRPFKVHTGPLTTTVLGTSFNIRTYASENKVTIALLTGKVKIDHHNPNGHSAPALVLMPSEQVSFDRGQFNAHKTTFAHAGEITAWKNGYLVFKDASYGEIQSGIENHFGVTLINQSNKKEWKYTGTFHRESLKEVIETICLATSLSWSIQKDKVYLLNNH